MGYRKEIVEFLSAPENLQFLLEIEPLIPEAKDYRYEKCFKKFEEEYLIPNVWPNYSYAVKDNTFILEDEQYKGEDYFTIHIHVGQRDKNNWYGIYGNEKTLNQPQSEFTSFREQLKILGVTGRDKWTLAYAYFERNRLELLTLPDSAIDDFLSEWSDVFWTFASNIKTFVESANAKVGSIVN